VVSANRTHSAHASSQLRFICLKLVNIRRSSSSRSQQSANHRRLPTSLKLR
jgi:hypothetical protein